MCVRVLGRRDFCEGFLEIGAFCAGGDIYGFGIWECLDVGWGQIFWR